MGCIYMDYNHTIFFSSFCFLFVYIFLMRHVSFGGVLMSSLFMFLLFLCLFLGIYGSSCWFSLLMVFIFEPCVCDLVRVSAPSVCSHRCMLYGASVS